MKFLFIAIMMLVGGHQFELKAQVNRAPIFWNYSTEVGSKHYWEYGTGCGSKYYWEYGTGYGSKYYWEYGKGCGSKYFGKYGTGWGSKYYWENATGRGSKYYWNYGTGNGSKSHWNYGYRSPFAKYGFLDTYVGLIISGEYIPAGFFDFVATTVLGSEYINQIIEELR